MFGKQDLPTVTQSIDPLKDATESDGVRILEHHLTKSNVAQFLVSTTPEIAPSLIVRSLKGRLQYIYRDSIPKLFRRNYSIRSVGEASANKLDRYINIQTAKHPMADPGVQAQFEAIQYHDPEVDLRSIQTGNYGQFLNSQQLVVEFNGGWHETRIEQSLRIRNIVQSCARKHGWKLSRIGQLSNHLHILLGADVKEAPAAIAIAMMNNIAYVYQMTSVLKFSYYLGTFGGYDRGAVRKVVAADRDKLDGAPGLRGRSM